jgi:hypothetical protein
MPKTISNPSNTVLSEIIATDRIPVGRVGVHEATVYEMSTILSAIGSGSTSGDIDGGTPQTVFETFDDIDGGTP